MCPQEVEMVTIKLKNNERLECDECSHPIVRGCYAHITKERSILCNSCGELKIAKRKKR